MSKLENERKKYSAFTFLSNIEPSNRKAASDYLEYIELVQKITDSRTKIGFGSYCSQIFIPRRISENL